MKQPTRALAAAAALLVSPSAFAACDRGETEANDTPAAAEPLAVGACVSGEMRGRDQDAFAPAFPADDVVAVTLEAEGGGFAKLDLFRLERDSSGALNDYQTVASFASPRGGGSARRTFSVSPGEYMIGLSKAGGAVRYTLSLSTPGDPEDAVVSARGRGDGEVAWSVDGAAADQLWRVRLDGPAGAAPRLRIAEAEGGRLVAERGDAWGAIDLAPLGLDEGEYALEVDADDEAPWRLAAVPVGPRAPGLEREPNDAGGNAQSLAGVSIPQGRLHDGGDVDRYALPLEAGETLRLSLRAMTLDEVELCLAPEGRNGGEECRRGRRSAAFDAVTSPSGGVLVVSVSKRGDAAAPYLLRATPAAQAAPGDVAEPNAARADAVDLAPDGTGRGRLVASEHDHFVVTAEERGLWRINVAASGNLERLTYLGGRFGDHMVRAEQRRHALMDSLVLPPGRHVFRLTGAGEAEPGEYLVRARRIGPVDPAREMEPNGENNATPIRPGDRRTGVVALRDHADFYALTPDAARPLRIRLAARGADVDLRVEPAVGEVVRGRVSAGREVVLERRFEAGETLIEVERRAEDAAYTIAVEAMDPAAFARRIDREPNNRPDTATPLPFDGRVTGDVLGFADSRRAPDVYRLPEAWAGRDLVLTGTAPGARTRIIDRANDRVAEIEISESREAATAASTPDRAPLFLQIRRGDAPYDLQIWPAGETPPDPARADLSAGLAISDEDLPLAAHRPEPQLVSGTLAVRNTGRAAVRAGFDVRAAIAGARVRFAPEEAEIAAGETLEVPFEAVMPPNLPARRPVALRARVDAPVPAVAEIELHAEAGRMPRRPAPDRGLPESMRGGLNVAWRALGGRVIESESREDDRRSLPDLIDGMVGRDSRHEARIREDDAAATAALAFDAAPVAGVVIYPHPSQARRRPASAPAWAAVELRTDGAWREVWRGDLASGQAEHVIPFAETRRADAARLRLRPFHGRTVSLSEIAVIADPAHDPTAGEGFDIARFALGGEMLGGAPGLGDAYALLQPERDEIARFREEEGEDAASFTIAFRFHRRAELSEIAWRPAEADAEQAAALAVAASADGLAGPWRPLGELTPSEPRLVFETPAEARYLRFTPRGGRTVGRAVAVRERAPGADYASVLGFLGRGLRREAPDTAARTAATFLLQPGVMPLGAPVSGVVERGRREQRYDLALPAPANRLVLAFDSAFPVLPEALLEGPDGEPAPLLAPTEEQAAELREALSIPDGHALRIAEAGPGSHTLVLREPRRSLLVAWDSSGSVAAFRPAMFQALGDLASELNPETDAVGLLPFGRDSLLDQAWLTDPDAVRSLLRSPGSENSSSATRALRGGLEELGARPGARAVVLVTDMDDPSIDYRSRRVYDQLVESRALMFAGQIDGGGLSSGDALVKQRRRMRGWALASGGAFMETASPRQVVDLFETAAGRLRGPKPYAVTAYAYEQAPPAPGRLQVTLSDDGGGSEDGLALNPVEIVLDASGSMLQRLPDGRRRIAAAKDAIRDLVETRLPEGTPTALRVFGHVEPGSCDTRLVGPLEPLEPAAFSERLDAIYARNLAETPIAESLSRTANDLAGADGRPVIVLLSDGEETCGGDPAAAIRALQDQGLDVTVNVIGFAVDGELDDTFSEWAELGGGAYFKADDADELGAALERAVLPVFEIRDSAGAVVGRGRPGDPALELAPERYTVVFSNGQTRQAEVESEALTRLELVLAD